MNKIFAQRWLATQCSLLPAVHSAVFMVPDRQKNLMRIVAKWPAELSTHKDFSDIVKYVMKKRAELCIPNAQVHNNQAFDFFALPIYQQKALAGVIVIKIKHVQEKLHKAVFKSLRQSVKWMGMAAVEQAKDDDFYSQVVGLLASCFEQNSYHEGLLKMVTELTRTLNCERVAFAEFQRHHCRVVALSNSANFDDRSNLLQKIADAMDEAIDQDTSIVFPESANLQHKLIQRAHQDLARKYGSGSICTIPLINDKKIFGAVTLLRSEEQPFDSDTVHLSEQTLSLLTPFLALKRDDEKNLIYKTASALKKQAGMLFGLRYLKLKLFSIALVTLIAFTSLIESEFRVSSDAILEGRIQRVVAAPVSGYLLSARVRAGDTVAEGDEMASLDDAELKLELARFNGELQKARQEYRQAQSTRDLVKVRIISEQMNQTEAEIELTRQQLDKIHLIAPFDGVVIEGDLTQLLGSPVERGDPLFKIAPLEGYRIILKVDESQIAYVKPQQTGTLALSSLSARTFPLTVEKITAVAKADDGANIFRVEASLDNPPELLRPGMEGVGKINAGQARLIWIWTHEITDWFRLWLWSWWP
jgi:RND family efflux transporter MFP subunit